MLQYYSIIWESWRVCGLQHWRMPCLNKNVVYDGLKMLYLRGTQSGGYSSWLHTRWVQYACTLGIFSRKKFSEFCCIKCVKYLLNLDCTTCYFYWMKHHKDTGCAQIRHYYHCCHFLETRRHYCCHLDRHFPKLISVWYNQCNIQPGADGVARTISSRNAWSMPMTMKAHIHYTRSSWSFPQTKAPLLAVCCSHMKDYKYLAADPMDGRVPLLQCANSKTRSWLCTYLACYLDLDIRFVRAKRGFLQCLALILILIPIIIYFVRHPII